MQSLTLLSKRTVASGLVELSFTKPDNWPFQAGQFARLGLVLSEGEEPVFRAYSIASAPEADSLRFLIKCVTDGALSPRLTALEEGEKVLLDGPADGNLLPARIPGGSSVWLFATGSGLAPFLAMLESETALAEWSEAVAVIGCRTQAEAEGLKNLLLLRSKKTVKIIAATTREDTSLTGRLPELLESGDLEEAAGQTINAQDTRVLLCGNPGFTKDLRALLKARGMVSPRFGKPGQVLVEALW